MVAGRVRHLSTFKDLAPVGASLLRHRCVILTASWWGLVGQKADDARLLRSNEE